MSSYDYWKEREEAQRKKDNKDIQSYSAEIKKIYQNMMDQISNEIHAFYSKYASDTGITMAEAIKRANKLDMEEYSRKAKKYVEEKNFSEQANAEMKLYNMTMKVNRLELLKANIGLELVSGHDELEKFFQEELEGKTIEELERLAGILGDSIQDNKELARSIVNASFHNATFSDRIWMHQDLLKNDINSLLQTGLIQGRNPNVLARELRRRFNVKKSDAERLMRTEMARVQVDAQMRSYEANDIEEYEYIACGGSDVCSICKALDGKIFKVSKMMPAKNAPPMHPNCHCSTGAHIDDKDYEDWLSFIESGGTTKEWNSLTKENKHAINSYVSSSSYFINDVLRNGYKLDDEQKEIVKNLDDALNKMHPYEGDLTRSVYFYDVQSFDNFLKEYEVGKILTIKQYLSTTKGDVYNPEAQVQLKILNSKNGINISAFNNSEDEVLYKRNSKFKVIRIYIENDVTYIELEEA
ncbi:minor capsid protein [uncultured Thomasclavelia sp.]|uniref:minor capsid protein n=1 Tax=uncultured Thomasclavelia sp. TaxID=3025759 RepID=UPI00261E8422|nr:minor capsid protein [uncultured Thomasclavelia sp.]